MKEGEYPSGLYKRRVGSYRMALIKSIPSLVCLAGRGSLDSLLADAFLAPEGGVSLGVARSWGLETAVGEVTVSSGNGPYEPIYKKALGVVDLGVAGPPLGDDIAGGFVLTFLGEEKNEPENAMGVTERAGYGIKAGPESRSLVFFETRDGRMFVVASVNPEGETVGISEADLDGQKLQALPLVDRWDFTLGIEIINPKTKEVTFQPILGLGDPKRKGVIAGVPFGSPLEVRKGYGILPLPNKGYNNVIDYLSVPDVWILILRELGLNLNKFKLSPNGREVRRVGNGELVLAKDTTDNWIPPVTFDSEVVSAIETSLPGVRVLGENLVYNGAIIEGLKVVDLGEGKYGFERAPYEFTTPEGETMKMVTTAIEAEEVKIDQGGRLVIPAFYWDAEVGENGAWVRKKVIVKGEETGMVGYTREEMMAVVLSENKWLEKTGQIDDVYSPARLESRVKGRAMIDVRAGGKVKLANGIELKVATTRFYGDNVMYRAQDGVLVEKIPTPLYVWTSVEEGNYTLVRWLGGGKDGEMTTKEVIVPGNWTDDLGDQYGDVIDVHKKTGMTFFRIEAGSEFDLTFAQQ